MDRYERLHQMAERLLADDRPKREPVNFESESGKENTDDTK